MEKIFEFIKAHESHESLCPVCPVCMEGYNKELNVPLVI